MSALTSPTPGDAHEAAEARTIELDLSWVELGEAGARLLASRRWPRLEKLNLARARLGDAGLAALARGEWPALEWLNLGGSGLGAPLALEDARRWAPALVELFQ
jgi:hypothetical protein